MACFPVCMTWTNSGPDEAVSLRKRFRHLIAWVLLLWDRLDFAANIQFTKVSITDVLENGIQPWLMKRNYDAGRNPSIDSSTKVVLQSFCSKITSTWKRGQDCSSHKLWQLRHHEQYNLFCVWFLPELCLAVSSTVVTDYMFPRPILLGLQP